MIWMSHRFCTFRIMQKWHKKSKSVCKLEKDTQITFLNIYPGTLERSVSISKYEMSEWIHWRIVWRKQGVDDTFGVSIIMYFNWVDSIQQMCAIWHHLLAPSRRVGWRNQLNREDTRFLVGQITITTWQIFQTNFYTGAPSCIIHGIFWKLQHSEADTPSQPNCCSSAI